MMTRCGALNLGRGDFCMSAAFRAFIELARKYGAGREILSEFPTGKFRKGASRTSKYCVRRKLNLNVPLTSNGHSFQSGHWRSSFL